jgi:hypothetical protein
VSSVQIRAAAICCVSDKQLTVREMKLRDGVN